MVFFSIVFGKTVSWGPALQVLVGVCSSSFLSCTLVARSLMTKCLSEGLTRSDPWITLGPGTRLPKVTTRLLNKQERKRATEWSSQFLFLPVFKKRRVSPQARVRKDRVVLKGQGKLIPVCEFPFVFSEVKQKGKFLLQSKRTCVPSGTKQAPRRASARAQGPTGPCSGTPGACASALGRPHSILRRKNIIPVVLFLLVGILWLV